MRPMKFGSLQEKGTSSHLTMSSVPLVSIKDFENYAYSILPRNILDYYRSGAGAQETLINNRKAFSKFRIRPRCLRNVAKRDLSTTILGHKISMPIGISPTAMQRMAHPDGECANARAAEAIGTIFTLSIISTSSIEEVAQAAPNGIKWFQLYIYNDREVTRKLVERAEKANFKALVVTIDVPIFDLRLDDVRNNFVPPPHLTFANFSDDKATGINKTEERSDLINYVNKLFDSTLDWSSIKWLKSITKLPIVLKGILTAEDALLAIESGADAILVSNHGGRQLDGVPATIEALPEIVKAVQGRVEVYLDGGVSDGTDVMKALALGAQMVLMGRPAIWGLAHSGEDGVKRVLQIIKKELDYALALTGCASVKDIERNMVVHESYYSRL